MDSSSSYLEEFLESIETVPPLCKRNFTLMRQLDRKAFNLAKEIEDEQDEYLQALKSHMRKKAHLPKVPSKIQKTKSKDSAGEKDEKGNAMEVDGDEQTRKTRGKDKSKGANDHKGKEPERVSRAQAECDKQQEELEEQLRQIELKRMKIKAIHVEKDGVSRQTTALVETQIGSLDAQLNNFERWLRDKGNWETGGGLRPGDEVAAKMSATENLWILAHVLHYYPPGSIDGGGSLGRSGMGAGLAEEMYEVADADDDNRRYTLPLRQLVELPDPDSTNIDPGQWAKGDRVLAIDRDKDISELYLQVQFDDDHDESGFIPHRPVPLRFVLEVP